MVSLRELVTVEHKTIEPSIYHKNLRRVVYVTGDVAGAVESPVYAILQMNKDLDHLTLPAGYTLARYNSSMPDSTDHYSMKWDGEWHITIEVFRDMGLAFAAVLVLIYVLVVGWFRSFLVPLIIMAPIPLTLVGIHAGSRNHGRILYCDFHDRLHRGRGHHRAQLDHSCRFH